MKAKELTIKFKASVGDISRSFAHFFKKTFVSLNSTYEALSASIKPAKSSLLKALDFKKLSNLAASVGKELTHSIRSAVNWVWVRLKSLTRVSINSLFIIIKAFYRYTKNSFNWIRVWYFKRFKSYRGIAICCGLEYRPEVGEAIKSLINKFEFRYTYLSDPVRSMYAQGKTTELAPLFFNSLSLLEKEKLNTVREILLLQPNPTIHQSIDILKIHLGKLFLLKKQFDPNVFTIFFYVLAPEECRFLKQQGYYLLYLQSMNNAYLTDYDTGLTFGSQRFNKYIFPDREGGITITKLEELFRDIITGVVHR
jgi:hypothetical protein